jgi:hypothetical protein
MFFQWRCPQEDCRVNLPMEGVTTMSKCIVINLCVGANNKAFVAAASAESLNKTGIRMNQYELLSCVRS